MINVYVVYGLLVFFVNILQNSKAIVSQYYPLYVNDLLKITMETTSGYSSSFRSNVSTILKTPLKDHACIFAL